jgi:signal transduction histidine kinase
VTTQAKRPGGRLPSSLRLKVALGVALPLLLILTGLSVLSYWRASWLMQEQIGAGAEELGQVTLGSLRHAMVRDDQAVLLEILADLHNIENVQRVEIIGLSGDVAAASDPASVGQTRSQSDIGCSVCHQVPAAQRPLTARLQQAPGVLRVTSPIPNDAECTVCHGTQVTHLGMLLIDISIANTQARLLGDLKLNLGLSVLATMLVSLAVFGLTHRLVVGRIERFEAPLTQLAAGDFNARLPESTGGTDELDRLAKTFNQMAENLLRLTRENELRGQVRQQAITEERERIARELHDGLAQLLGYVNTKVTAVRLLLRNRQSKAAQEQLEQLSEASRALFTDVREAIVGLKLASQSGQGLASAIQDYIDQFRRLADLTVEVHIEAPADAVRMSAETELQLIRILQEALSNARRHASASHALVDLQVCNGSLQMTIEDNGQGFDPACPPDSVHFGLRNMRDRATDIGGKLDLLSAPGQGTKVVVTVDLDGPPGEAGGLP